MAFIQLIEHAIYLSVASDRPELPAACLLRKARLASLIPENLGGQQSVCWDLKPLIPYLKQCSDSSLRFC